MSDIVGDGWSGDTPSCDAIVEVTGFDGLLRSATGLPLPLEAEGFVDDLNDCEVGGAECPSTPTL